MKNVRPSTEYTALLLGAPSGLVGTLTVGVIETGGTQVVAQTTDGIIELTAPSGNYAGTVTLPAEEGLYIVQWINDDVEILDDDILKVTSSAILDVPALEDSYASRGDLDAYLEDGLPLGYTDEYLDKVLVKASEDVDLYSSNVWSYPAATSPRKYYFDSTPTWREDIGNLVKSAVVEATCAQAEYRLAKGDQFFVEKPRAEGEFSGTQVLQPRFGPKAEEALRRVGFPVRIQTATLR
jgi:hypothetical protein